MKTPLCVSGTQCVIYTWQCSWWHHWWPQHKHINAPTVSPNHHLGLGDKRQQEKQETLLLINIPRLLGQQMNSFLSPVEGNAPVCGQLRMKPKAIQCIKHINTAMYLRPSLSSSALFQYVLSVKQLARVLISHIGENWPILTCGISVVCYYMWHKRFFVCGLWNRSTNCSLNISWISFMCLTKALSSAVMLTAQTPASCVCTVSVTVIMASSNPPTGFQTSPLKSKTLTWST